MSIAENRIVLTDSAGRPIVVGERTTLTITSTIKDSRQPPVVIPISELTAVTLTLYVRDVAAQTILNTVDHVNILNTGRATLHATSGLMTLTLLPADTQVVDQTLDQEWHRALIEWTYNGGDKAGRMEIDFPVRNLSKVS